ncbi:MAG: hypothetical protein AAGF07_05155 [Patescibacteria group bacterium]
MRAFLVFLKKITPRLISVLLSLTLLFSLLQTINVRSQTADGVGGFSGCDFSSVQNNPQGGSELFEACIRQVITFLFVIGLFLIVFRIGISAFNSMNPGASGDAIKDSVGAIRDIMIGLLLIIAPSIILATINPAALSLNFLDLGNLTSDIGSGGNGDQNSTDGSRNSNGSNGNNSQRGGNNSNNGGGRSQTEGNASTNSDNNVNTSITPGQRDENGNILPNEINSPADLNAALEFYIANPTTPEATNTISDFLSKGQSCNLGFILSDEFSVCNDIDESYSPILSEVSEKFGTNPPLEQPTNYNGIVRATTDVQTISSAKDGEDQILVIKYTPRYSDFGQTYTYESTIKISGCPVDEKITIPGNILNYGELITTEDSCNIKIISTN